VRPRLLILVTHPMTARILMRGQLAHLVAAGFEVAVGAAPGPELDAVAANEGVTVFPVPFTRRISPGRDLVALARTVGVIRRFGPTIVNSGTPKAGLLGMLAARLCRVPVRIYTVRGLRLETSRGLSRHVLAASERLAARCAHRVVFVSESLRRRSLELALAPEEKTATISGGSSNGVDLDRFRPAAPGEAEALRRELGIPPDAPVVGFVGRWTRDKGIADLAEAFSSTLLPRHPECRLLLVGDWEEGDPVPAEVRDALRAHPRVVRPGFVDDPAPYYRVMDVLAFPSYREGLPNAPLEAAASAVPVVGYAATGTVDAVGAGSTGTLVTTGDRPALAAALAAYLADPALAVRHGTAGREWGLQRFASHAVWSAWVDLYCRELSRSGAATCAGAPEPPEPPRRRDAAGAKR
jgi:glycosyltransferase involved in cell wall biosynthesis